MNIFYPKSIKELTNNSDKIQMITSWLNEDKYNTKKNKILLIIGEHGIGKTKFIEILLEELNYQILKVDILNLSNIKNIPEYINNLTNNIDAVSMLNNCEFKQQKPHVILIDNLETINSRNDKKIIKDLININNGICPIICITDNTHDKFISNIKLISDSIIFSSPSQKEINNLFLKISKHYNLIFENNTIINDFISYCQCDYKKCYSVLSDLIDINKTITQQIFDDYMTIHTKKNIDNGLFMNVCMLLSNYEGITSCIEKYDSEKTFIPLTLDHNIIKYILAYYDETDNNKFEIIKQISDLLVISNKIDKYIYNEQSWDLELSHKYMSCIYPSYLLYKNDIQTDSTKLLKSKFIEFASETNKSTLKQINLKKQCLDADFVVNDYLKLEKITKLLLKNNKHIECKKIYNNNINIEQIIKINKITSDKYIITKNDKDLLNDEESKNKKKYKK